MRRYIVENQTTLLITISLTFLTFCVLIWQVILLKRQVLAQFTALNLQADSISVQQKSVLAQEKSVLAQEKAMDKDHERRKKQATFEAMQVIRSNTSDQLERSIRKQVNDHTNWAKVPEQLRSETREVLSGFERFAVAVNTGVYDIEIVDRTMGSYLMKLWQSYDEYVAYVRKKVPDANKKYYCDLEELVKNIEKRRANQSHMSGVIGTN